MRHKDPIATRGEEPRMIPGGAQDAWRNVEFGLGAAPHATDLDPHELKGYPPRPFAKFSKAMLRWGLIAFGIFAMGVVIFQLVSALK